MKTTKYILLIFLLGCSAQFMATTFSPVSAKYSHMKDLSTCEITEMPSTHFESTSVMELSGSSLSSTTSAIGSDNPNSNNGMSGPRRIGGGNQGGGSGPDNPDDVYNDPLGDAVIPLLLIAVGYSIYLRRKNSVRTPEAGHNQ